jgi:transcriptional regulator with XRE-family HTH domain
MNEWSYIIRVGYDQLFIVLTKGEDVMNQLKEMRKSKGFTQTQIAERVGVTLRSYQRYEAEENGRYPDVLVALGIADALQVKDLRKIWGNPDT